MAGKLIVLDIVDLTYHVLQNFDFQGVAHPREEHILTNHQFASNTGNYYVCPEAVKFLPA